MRRIAVASNPAKRRRTQTPAQRRASLKNLAKARRARGGTKRRRTTTKRRRNPSTAPTARRSVAANPRKRRSSVASFRRRNPSGRGVMGIVNRQVIPALIMGGGAVGNDVLFNLIVSRVPMIPVQFTTGPMRHAAKALSALGLGYAASFAVGKRTADQLVTGALTVIGYNVVRDMVARFAPGVQMGEYLSDGGLGYYGAGLNPGYEYDAGNMGEYLNGPPGTGVGIGRQLTQGTPYLAPANGQWPTESEAADLSMQYET